MNETQQVITFLLSACEEKNAQIKSLNEQVNQLTQRVQSLSLTQTATTQAPANVPENNG